MSFSADRLNILLTGASGYVGSRLLLRLVKRGYRVQCLARNPAKLLHRNLNGVDIVKGDTLDSSSLEGAFENIDIAYYLIHSMTGSGDFEEKDARSAKNFAAFAQRASVKRIIYLGGLANPNENLSDHLNSRQQVGKILAESGIPVTELRASIIIGSGSASFEIIRDLVNKLPVMITPRWVRSKCQPIAIRDVLNYLVRVLEKPETAGRIFDIGGDEVLTYEEMMRRVAQINGKRLRILHVPVLTPHLSAYWLNLVTSVPMRLAFPLVEGMRNDTVRRDFELDNIIPIRKTPFDDAVRRALLRERKMQIESRWTEADSFSPHPAQSTHQILYDRQEVQSTVPADKIFEKIQIIGGENGWYYADWAWRLRGFFDRVIGGVGMRRGRRHPVDLRTGDTLDFWRVENYQPGQSLKLRAEMKLPGTAWLEFIVKQDKTVSYFTQIASFIPYNLTGYIYWYLLFPAHYFIFRNMAKKIIKSAEDSV
jgi:uncharacterized protein YbjT (DUF2867 family)